MKPNLIDKNAIIKFVKNTTFDDSIQLKNNNIIFFNILLILLLIVFILFLIYRYLEKKKYKNI